MRYRQSLVSILEALHKDIAPSLQSARGRICLNAIQETLIGLVLDADARSAGGSGAIADTAPAEHSNHHDPSLFFEFYGGEQHCRDRVQELKGLFAAPRTPESPQRLAELLSWEQAVLEGIDRRRAEFRSADSAAPLNPQHKSSLDADALTAYICARTPASADFRVVQITPFAGGHSKFTALIEASASSELPPRFVFRQDKALSTTGGPSVIGEYALQRRLHELGIRLPAQYLLEASPAPLGQPFLLAEFLTGAPASGLLTPPYSKAVALELARELARIHRIAPQSLQGAVAQLAPPSAQAILSELAGFEQSWRLWPLPHSPAMEFGLIWLRDHIACATSGPVALVHRDPLFHNVLADGDRYIALIDWEFARIGYAAEDLGWIRAAVEGRLAWTEFMAAYEGAGGPVIETAQQDFYDVWACVRLASMIAYSNSLLDSGTINGVDSMKVVFNDTYVTLLWLSRHLARILAAKSKQGRATT
jgi:aminoglycoside phosphotransferase (APT) family kinase protein